MGLTITYNGQYDALHYRACFNFVQKNDVLGIGFLGAEAVLHLTLDLNNQKKIRSIH